MGSEQALSRAACSKAALNVGATAIRNSAFFISVFRAADRQSNALAVYTFLKRRCRSNGLTSRLPLRRMDSRQLCLMRTPQRWVRRKRQLPPGFVVERAGGRSPASRPNT
jgi:hypothetical protein